VPADTWNQAQLDAINNNNKASFQKKIKIKREDKKIILYNNNENTSNWERQN
jgi:hypothetical protein